MANYNKKYMLGFMLQLLHPSEVIDSNYFKFTDTFWEILVKLASSHLVLPAIYRALIRKKLDKYVPKDLLSYLREITKINQGRNSSILKQIAFLSKVFSKNKIEYVFLKGAAMLILKPYDTVNERMIGDIDVLVAEKDLLRAQQILIDNGFEEIKDDFNFVEGIISHRHLKRIIHPSYIAAVELHSQLMVDDKLDQIRSNDVIKNRIKFAKGYPIPPINHLWVHAILSWQYNDNGFYYNTFFKKMETYAKSLNMSHLSMGMSDDYIEALKHSATFIRVGSKIMGKRI